MNIMFTRLLVENTQMKGERSVGREQTRYVVIDCETTGLSPAQGDRMVSFAGIEIIGDAPTGEAISLIFNPDRKSNPHALRIHGLADHVLRYQRPFSESAEVIQEFLGDAVIVGHNVEFDLSFLRHEFKQCGRIWMPADSLCTMNAFRHHSAGRTTLDAAASHFGIDASIRSKFHGAFVDAEITSRLFQKIILCSQHMHSIPHMVPINFIDPPSLIQGQETKVEEGERPISGRAFAITGELTGMSREEAAAKIIALGGVWHKTVKKNTDFLVIGHAPGSGKIDTAAARRVKYGKPENIDERRFLSFLSVSDRSS